MANYTRVHAGAVSGRGGRAAHDQARRGRPHRHDPHPGPRQGPRGGQGRPQDASRFGARLEPTSRVALQCYRGRELDIVTQAETIDANRALREEYALLTHAIPMLEAVDQVAQEHEPNPALYRMLDGRAAHARGAAATRSSRPRSSGSCSRSKASTRCSTAAPAAASAERDGDARARRVRSRRGRHAVPRVRARRWPAAVARGARPAAPHARRRAQRRARASRRAPARTRSSTSASGRSSITSSAACARPRCSEPPARAPARDRAGVRPIAWPAYGTGRRSQADGPRRQPREAPRAGVPVVARSTAASAPPGTTGRSACCSSATSRTPGGARWCSSATTSSASTPRSSWRPKVWEASGHVATFTDPLVDCRNCKERFRADQLPESGACPNCGAKDSFTEARNFNLMFKTHVGPVEDDASVAYLRPETAQGIFVNFKNVQTTTRKKPPFGIAQIGKSFRNEITPGNFIFRTREFEQMEMEFFVPPDDGAEVVRVLGAGALPLVPRPRHPRGRCCASARTTPTSSRTTRPARATSSSCTRGVGASSRASRTAPTSTSRSTRSSRARTSRTSTRRTTSTTCRT